MAINYTEVGWDTTKYVNPTNMNQMDDGIKAACDGVDTINAGTITGGTIALTSDLSALYARGSYYPTLLSGGDSITFDAPINYCKFGSIVVLSHAFWSVSITNATSEHIVLSLPYAPNMTRFIGKFGYRTIDVEYTPVVAEGTGLVFMKSATADVVGTDITSFIGQWSLVYTTNE